MRIQLVVSPDVTDGIGIILKDVAMENFCPNFKLNK